MFDVTHPIRLLTLKQPFASLLFFGKDKETRSRSTKYKGQLLISASIKPYSWDAVESICTFEQFEWILKWAANEGKGHEKLCGKAIGVANLDHCQPMEDEDEEDAMVEYHQELFSWQLSEQKLIVPFPIKGSIIMPELDLETKNKITIYQTTLEL